MTRPEPVVVRVDGERIIDWPTFFDAFSAAFGFPASFGRNMDAWIDCLSCLDDPAAGMTAVHAAPGGVVTLVVDHVDALAARCPEQYTALVEGVAFVNWRLVEKGERAVLALAFDKRA